jgi:hypothetical protein
MSLGDHEDKRGVNGGLNFKMGHGQWFINTEEWSLEQGCALLGYGELSSVAKDKGSEFRCCAQASSFS